MKLYIKFVVILIAMSIVGLFQGCGSMEKILPDRKKEYRFSSEIPPLEIPPDLTASTIEKTPIKSTKTNAVSSLKQMPKEIEKPRVEPEPEGHTVVAADDGGSLIEIEKPYPIAWRMVGRALSQLEIEIDDLNRSEGLYYIIFRDQQDQQKDAGFWSGLAFWSDDNAAGAEEEYQVKLTDAKGVTEVRVLNDEGQVQSQGVGLNVLKMIQKQVNQQISKKQG